MFINNRASRLHDRLKGRTSRDGKRAAETIPQVQGVSVKLHVFDHMLIHAQAAHVIRVLVIAIVKQKIELLEYTPLQFMLIYIFVLDGRRDESQIHISMILTNLHRCDILSWSYTSYRICC